MLWFFKYFRWKILRKNLRFWLKTKLIFLKKLIITLVFKKNANFLAENWEKSQKIVIITSSPDWPNFRLLDSCLLWTVFCKLNKYPKFIGYCFPLQKLFIDYDNKWVGLYLGRYFHNLIWSPCSQSVAGGLLPALKSENNQKGTNLLFGHLIFSVRIFFIQMYMHAYVCNDVPRSRYQFWVARFWKRSGFKGTCI
jgi:hypothetical protein